MCVNGFLGTHCIPFTPFPLFFGIRAIRQSSLPVQLQMNLDRFDDEKNFFGIKELFSFLSFTHRDE